MSVRPEAIACEALRDWLLLQLPAKVTEVNAARAPVLRAPRAGPYVITTGMTLPVSIDDPATPTNVALTTGSRSAAQVAADVNGTPGLLGVGSADSEGRFLLTGPAPTGANATAVYVAHDTTGAALVFGWNDGGERSVRQPLIAPLSSGVCDGWPVILDCGPGFWVIIGKRVSRPVNPGDIRADQHLVAVELTILLKDTNIQNSRSREAIEACLQCVQEVLLTERGRYAGRDGLGDVQKVEEHEAVIPGTPWMATDEQGNRLGIFDTATYSLVLRVYARPAAT